MQTNQTLVDEIHKAIDGDPRCERTSESRDNRLTTSFTRGGARVEVPLRGVATVRREGADVEHLSGTIAEMTAAAVDALATGRTLLYGKGVGLRDYQHRMHGQSVDHDWRFLVPRITGQDTDHLDPPWCLNPDYQRGPVWTQQQQARFIGHVLSGGEVPLIICQRYDGPEHCTSGDWLDAPVEVVDGQQRLRAICAFVNGDVPAELLHGGRWVQLWWNDFDEQERRNRACSSRIMFVDLPRAERLRFYLRLNSGGTVHTTEELERVRAMLAEEVGE